MRLLALLWLLGAPSLAAQGVGIPATTPTPLIGSPLEDRARLDQLLGREQLDGFLHRTLSSRLPAPDSAGASWSILEPTSEYVWNSSLPFSLNEGPLWAGRGSNGILTAGVRFTTGVVDIVLAPQFTYSENREYQTIDLLGREDDVYLFQTGARYRITSAWSASANYRLRDGQSTEEVADYARHFVSVEATYTF